VTIGRRHEKSCVALLTCLTVRALHLDLAEDLSSDACIVVIRKFVNRRGVPNTNRSDMGTNFDRVDNILKKTYDFFDSKVYKRNAGAQGHQLGVQLSS